MIDKLKYNSLIDNISEILQKSRDRTYRVVNFELINCYWLIGKHIIEYEQDGNIKAEYGKQLLDQLSKDLSAKFGKGFSRTNVVYIRLFYIKYPIGQTVSDQLSWSHYIELLSVSDDLERSFYESQTKLENWSVRELKRQNPQDYFNE